MSNKRKPTAQPGQNKGLAAYRAEVKGEPFRLPLDDEDGTVLEVPRPSGNRMMEAEHAYQYGSSRDVIVAFCGDQAEQFLAAVGDDDLAVMLNIVADMREHFGLGE